jgi:hypothetical protein
MRVADKSVTFAQLQENAARYEGTPWAFEGKIADIIAADTREFNQYFVAEVMIGDDPAKTVSIRGDFLMQFSENDYVYVVGYVTGTSSPRLGPAGVKYPGNVPGFSVRALLRPSEASSYLKASL